MPSSFMKARAYFYLKLNSAIYSGYYSTGKLGFALKLFLETVCSISKLKLSLNEKRKQWLSPGRSFARFSRNTKNKPTASVGRSIGKQETKFTYAKAIGLPIVLLTD
jgi:hypothetical protein